jgi:hypothetical protein
MPGVGGVYSPPSHLTPELHLSEFFHPVPYVTGGSHAFMGVSYVCLQLYRLQLRARQPRLSLQQLWEAAMEASTQQWFVYIGSKMISQDMTACCCQSN